MWKSLFCLAIFCVLPNRQVGAIEIRAIIHDAAIIRQNLIRTKSVYQGDYAFTDYVYVNNHSKNNLNNEFFRIREYQITKWEQKPLAVVYKIRDPKGENHKILFEKELDTLVQAEQYIPPFFYKRCSFFRRGWEYELENMRIFVEEIDGLPPSIEIIGTSREKIFCLLKTVGFIEILNDSVPNWYCKFNEGFTD